MDPPVPFSIAVRWCGCTGVVHVCWCGVQQFTVDTYCHHREGPGSAAHVDILANHELLADVVALASGRRVQERVLSNVDSMAAAVWSRI